MISDGIKEACINKKVRKVGQHTEKESKEIVLTQGEKPKGY